MNLIHESIPRVLVVGASPDRVNHNAVMRSFVCEGFNEVLGDGTASQCGLEFAAAEVNRCQPKLVLVFGSCMPDVCNYGPLRDACDRIGSVLAFWLHDDPYEFDFGYRAVEVADYIFSNDRWAAIHYAHPRTYFLPLAASPRVHLREWSEDKKNDVFFCGVAFPNRVALLTDLMGSLSSRQVRLQGAEWPKSIAQARNERMTNESWCDACAESSITLNIGRSLHLANKRFQLDPATPGPRTFEAALSGTVQMMFVDGLGITDFFEPDREIILFDGPSDFSDQLDGLLADPARCRRISEAARERALREHTYSARIRALLGYINGTTVVTGDFWNNP